MYNIKRTKTEQITISTAFAFLFIAVVCVVSSQDVKAFQVPDGGPAYAHYKAGWDQAQADAYSDAGNGQYRDYQSQCQGHSGHYCDGYVQGYQDYMARNSHHLVDQQNVAENNANVKIDGNNNRVTIDQGQEQGNANGDSGNDGGSNYGGNGY